MSSQVSTPAKTAKHVRQAIADAAQAKTAAPVSSAASHVQRAIADAAQPRTAAPVSVVAPHVEAAVAGAAQPKAAAGPPAGQRRAAHVQAALQLKQTPSSSSPDRSEAGHLPTAASTPPQAAAQAMKRKREHTIEIYDHPFGKPKANMRKKRNVYYDEDSESDEETMVNSMENLSRTFRSYKRYTARVNRGDRPKKKLKKQVHTEAIGEALTMSRMLGDSSIDWKIAIETSVKGGTGIDQIWYQGSLSGGNIRKVAIVEAKGPGATLGRGYGYRQMSDGWIRAVLDRWTRSTNSGKKSWAKRILKMLRNKKSKTQVWAYVVKASRSVKDGTLSFRTTKRQLVKSSSYW